MPAEGSPRRSCLGPTPPLHLAPLWNISWWFLYDCGVSPGPGLGTHREGAGADLAFLQGGLRYSQLLALLRFLTNSGQEQKLDTVLSRAFPVVPRRPGKACVSSWFPVTCHKKWGSNWLLGGPDVATSGRSDACRLSWEGPSWRSVALASEAHYCAKGRGLQCSLLGLVMTVTLREGQG